VQTKITPNSETTRSQNGILIETIKTALMPEPRCSGRKFYGAGDTADWCRSRIARFALHGRPQIGLDIAL